MHYFNSQSYITQFLSFVYSRINRGDAIDRNDFEYILKCLDAQRMYVAARILMAYFIEGKFKNYFKTSCHASFSLL